MTRASRPLRVLMTADAVGGVWRYALTLAEELSGAGVEVILAVMGPAPAPDQAREAEAAGLTWVHRPFDLEWMPEARDLERADAWLLELEAVHAPDLIHLNGYAQAVLPFRAPVLVVAHSCVLSWWRAVKGEDAPVAWRAYRQRTEAALRAADLVVAPTAAFLRALEAIYGRLPQARVIGNGLPPFPRPAQPKQEVILAGGRLWDEAKNVQAVVAAASRVAWPVRVAGDGAVLDERGEVQWLGRLPSDAMAARFAEAAIFTAPARYEPFGLAALEAAGAGCALVLGDLDTLRELWEDAAVFVPPDEPDRLAGALQALIDDRERRGTLAAAAEARAASFTAARMADAYLDAYGRLLDAHSAPRLAS